MAASLGALMASKVSRPLQADNPNASVFYVNDFESTLLLHNPYRIINPIDVLDGLTC